MNLTPQNLLWYDAAQIIALLLFGVGLVWNLKLSIALKAGLDTVTALVHKMMTNDLEHLSADIREVRQMIIDHIQASSN